MKLNWGRDYSESEDNRVRSALNVPRGMVMVDASKLKDLIRDSEFVNKVRELGNMVREVVVLGEVVVMRDMVVVGVINVMMRQKMNLR